MHSLSDRTESLILGRFSRRALRRGHHVARRSGVAGSAGEERAMINPNAVLDPLPAAIGPSNDMIVLSFHHACRNNFGMILVRTQDDFMLVSPSHYDPERYLPGSCIQ